MKNKIIYTLIGIVGVLIISLGVTLAYWIANVEGTGETITLELADLKVILNDPTIVTETGIEPGWSTSKTFTVENEGNAKVNYNIVIKNLVNTLVSEEYLQYKITSDNGYNMNDYAPVPKASESTEEVLAYNIEIEGKVIHSYTIELRYIESNTNQSEDMGKIFSGNLSITEGNTNYHYPTLYDKLLSDNEARAIRESFNNVYTIESSGVLYVAEDPWTEDTNGDGVGETVYYFAGNTQNNWVKFGKDSSDNDLYWRIIRTNEDGGVRLLYAGTSMDTTEGYIGGIQVYNNVADNSMYVGYMYGTSGSLENNRTNENNSDIKTVIDNWYSIGLNTKMDGDYTYDTYISKTAIYCNDRATSSYVASGYVEYAAFDRLYTNRQPSYKCGNQINGSLYSSQSDLDKFSVSTASGGNGDLTYGIALITADEIAFSGASWDIPSPLWYYYNSENNSITGGKWWWTMTPFNFYLDGYAYMYRLHGTGNLGALNSAYLFGDLVTRPVLSLKSCTQWKSGNGSSSTPYEVTLSETCANLEN